MTIETKFNIGDEVYWLHDDWRFGPSNSIEKAKVKAIYALVKKDYSDLKREVNMTISSGKWGEKEGIEERFCFATPREALESMIAKERKQLNTAAKNSNDRIAELKKIVDELERAKTEKDSTKQVNG